MHKGLSQKNMCNNRAGVSTHAHLQTTRLSRLCIAALRHLVYIIVFLMAATWLRVSMLFWIHEKALRNHVHNIFLCAWLSKLQGLILFPLLAFELNNITTIATMCCFINMNIVKLLCYFVGWKLWNTTAVFVLCFCILLWLHQSAISRWDILRLLSCNPFYGVGVICTWWSTPVC